MSIPVRLVVQRHVTDEKFLAPIRHRAQEIGRITHATGNAQLRQVRDDFDHLLCAVVEQRGDLIRMQSQFSKTANGVYAEALSKLRAAVVEVCAADEERDEAWGERLDELARVTNRIFDEMELQFGGRE